MRARSAVFVILAMILVACGTGEAENSGEPFVFGEDDLCVWVDEEEVTEIVRDAYEEVGVDWDGTAVLTVNETAEYECEWLLAGTDGGEIVAYSSPVRGETEGVVAYDDLETSWVGLGAVVSNHPEFADDVLISNHAFGRYVFWVPTAEEALMLNVGLDVELDDELWEVPLFVVANRFLDEMNWTS